MNPPNSDSQPVYALSGLTQVFQRRRVLDIEQLSLETGRIHALLGPNGAGKTTLLNILAFLAAPSAGRVHFRGRQVRFNEKELRALRREVVMVEQHPILFSTTVFKNLEFGLKVRNVSRAQRAARIEAGLERVGMEGFAQAAAHRLSGGETQRVALARALVLKPRVLLCDEPTSSVDVENQAIITHILRQINAEQQITILFTSHDRAQAAELAHHTLLLDHGRLVKARYENIFSATVQTNEAGQATCSIHPHIRLGMEPALGEGVSPRNRRIFINPAAIRPVSGTSPSSEPNHLQGVVRQAGSANGQVRLVVDVGLLLVVTLTEKAYREHPPLVGDTLTLHIPPQAIELLRSGS
jgi:tungstate transport system ATP-binding protein